MSEELGNLCEPLTRIFKSPILVEAESIQFLEQFEYNAARLISI